jgi:hypothetical protein
MAICLAGRRGGREVWLDNFLGLESRVTPSLPFIFWFKDLIDLVRMHPALYVLGQRSYYCTEKNHETTVQEK